MFASSKNFIETVASAPSAYQFKTTGRMSVPTPMQVFFISP